MNGAPLKVLIVEDDTVLAEMYKKKFENEGVEVLLAADGKKGISDAKTAQPNLIILDIMLPGGMNGFDVLRDLKQDPQTCDIPVVVATNFDSQEKAATDLGAVAYLVKSNVKPDEIFAIAKKFLHR